MGINPNDPNYVQNMMNSPEVQGQMSKSHSYYSLSRMILISPTVVDQLLSDPAVLDQLIASNPQLQAMGPQVRQIMQSEHFRNFITNPQAMNNMMQMMGGGGGGAGGAGGGGFPPPGAFGFGSGQTQANSNASTQPGGGAPSNLFNPWASTTPSSPPPAGTDSTNPNPAAAGPGAFNPFGALGGQAGQAPDFNQMMQNLQQMQQMQQMFGGGGMGGMGGTGGAAASSTPQVPPEERFAVRFSTPLYSD